MKLKEIHLKNFKSAKNLKLDFNDNLNVFAGINGSGKTTILEAISYALSAFQKKAGHKISNPIPLEAINIESNQTTIESRAFIEEIGNIKWMISRVKPPRRRNMLTNLKEIPLIESKFPVLVYYPVKRIVNERTFNSRVKTDRSLIAKTDFASFYDWFEKAENARNEQDRLYKEFEFKKRLYNDWRIRQKRKSLLDELAKNQKSVDKYHSYEFEKIERMMEDMSYTNSFRAISVELELIEMVIHRNKELRYYWSVVDELMFFLRRSKAHYESEEFIFRLMRPFEELEFFEKENDVKVIKNLKDYLLSLIGFVISSRLNLSSKALRILQEVFTSKNFRKKEYYRIEKIIRIDEKDKFSRIKNFEKAIRHINNAISNMMPGFENLKIEGRPKGEMVISKNNVPFLLNNLSDGEKNLIALVGDLVRRFYEADPFSANPLNNEGIVLIDEIELHLHPKWQRTIIPFLTKTFPKAQFFITTHSPHILGNVKAESVYLLKDLEIETPDYSYGLNIERIIHILQEEDVRPEEIIKKFRRIAQLHRKNELNEMEEEIKELKKIIGEDADILRYEMLLRIARNNEAHSKK